MGQNSHSCFSTPLTTGCTSPFVCAPVFFGAGREGIALVVVDFSTSPFLVLDTLVALLVVGTFAVAGFFDVALVVLGFAADVLLVAGAAFEAAFEAIAFFGGMLIQISRKDASLSASWIVVPPKVKEGR